MADSVSKERRAELNRKWREAHPGYMLDWSRRNKDKCCEYSRKRYANGCVNYDTVKECVNRYHQTPKGRAQNLLTSYKQFDREKGWETDMTAEYIEKVITTEHCIYCDCDDWTQLGLDRIDNDLPHNFNNVVCACKDCNVKRGRRTMEEYLKIIGKSDKR